MTQAGKIILSLTDFLGSAYTLNPKLRVFSEDYRKIFKEYRSISGADNERMRSLMAKEKFIKRFPKVNAWILENIRGYRRL